MRHKLGVEFAACFTFFSFLLSFFYIIFFCFSISIDSIFFRSFAWNGTQFGPFVVVIIMVDLVATN